MGQRPALSIPVALVALMALRSSSASSSAGTGKLHRHAVPGTDVGIVDVGAARDVVDGGHNVHGQRSHVADDDTIIENDDAELRRRRRRRAGAMRMPQHETAADGDDTSYASSAVTERTVRHRPHRRQAKEANEEEKGSLPSRTTPKLHRDLSSSDGSRDFLFRNRDGGNEPTPTPFSCTDSPLGWKMDFGAGGTEYGCAWFADETPQWDTEFRCSQFEQLGTDGKNAQEACCVCGGGFRVGTSPPPTKSPTASPTKAPVTQPPTSAPTKAPVTESPTRAPTKSPVTDSPTSKPTEAPTNVPTDSPTASPTNSPTVSPTKAPVTDVPTKVPTDSPTKAPVTDAPTKVPTNVPTKAPVSDAPTRAPVTDEPTRSPTVKTRGPSKSPVTQAPTKAPVTPSPTEAPTTSNPTQSPTVVKTKGPSKYPTHPPTVTPGEPTPEPTTKTPTASPTEAPTTEPTESPTAHPTVTLGQSATTPATNEPTKSPTDAPTASPVAGATGSGGSGGSSGPRRETYCDSVNDSQDYSGDEPVSIVVDFTYEIIAPADADVDGSILPAVEDALHDDVVSAKLDCTTSRRILRSEDFTSHRARRRANEASPVGMTTDPTDAVDDGASCAAPSSSSNACYPIEGGFTVLFPPASSVDAAQVRSEYQAYVKDKIESGALDGSHSDLEAVRNVDNDIRSGGGAAGAEQVASDDDDDGLSSTAIGLIAGGSVGVILLAFLLVRKKKETTTVTRSMQEDVDYHEGEEGELEDVIDKTLVSLDDMYSDREGSLVSSTLSARPEQALPSSRDRAREIAEVLNEDEEEEEMSRYRQSLIELERTCGGSQNGVEEPRRTVTFVQTTEGFEFEDESVMTRDMPNTVIL